MSSLGLYFSGNIFILPSTLKAVYMIIEFLVTVLFSFNTLTMSYHYLLAFIVPDGKPPLITVLFLCKGWVKWLLLLPRFSGSLVFSHFGTMCLGANVFVFSLLACTGEFCLLFPQILFLDLFSLCFPSGIPVIYACWGTVLLQGFATLPNGHMAT